MPDYDVELQMFNEGTIRVVNVPAEDQANALAEADPTHAMLDTIFFFGQNDFQDKPQRSVSMGDVIHYDGKKYKVEGIGFSEVK